MCIPFFGGGIFLLNNYNFILDGNGSFIPCLTFIFRYCLYIFTSIYDYTLKKLHWKYVESMYQILSALWLSNSIDYRWGVGMVNAIQIVLLLSLASIKTCSSSSFSKKKEKEKKKKKKEKKKKKKKKKKKEKKKKKKKKKKKFHILVKENNKSKSAKCL